jgi:hypothetical protein
MPMHLPSGLYMQAALASYSFGREALYVAFIIGLILTIEKLKVYYPQPSSILSLHGHYLLSLP